MSITVLMACCMTVNIVRTPVCVAYKTEEAIVVPDCDCRMEKGMCVNSLKCAILKCARFALERHEHGHCSLNC